MKRCCTSSFTANARILPQIYIRVQHRSHFNHNKSHKIFPKQEKLGYYSQIPAPTHDMRLHITL